MQQEKIHVGARIPKDLYEQCVQHYGNMTNAINVGLDLLINQSVNVIENRFPQNENGIEGIELREQLKVKDALQESRLNDLHERIKITDSHQQNRIDDLKSQIQNLQDQLKIKDEQLDKRDSEIKSLTTITESQIRSFKMIGTKKPFWKFC